MKTKQYLVGGIGGPIAGSGVFQSEDLQDILIDYIIIDGIPESGLQPTPQYVHSYLEGILDRSPILWVPGQKLTVNYH
jgi:hypothetical protein